MTSVDVELGLTALAAMLSPTTLTFSILTLVLGDRPRRTGLWFFLGAFGVTMVIGVLAAFVARQRRRAVGLLGNPAHVGRDPRRRLRRRAARARRPRAAPPA